MKFAALFGILGPKRPKMDRQQPTLLRVHVERWPIAGSFTISRGAKTEAIVVVAELADGRHRGRGECVPYARYGETVDGVAAAIEAMGAKIASGLDRESLQQAMPAGAARNALDCAFWDLAAKRAGRPAHELAGLAAPKPLTTAYTISLATPEAMAEAAAKAADRALLKVKLGGADDAARIAAVRRASPRSELIVDANEGWTAENLARNLAACAQAGVTLVEQPLPADRDDALARMRRPLPVCADESVHGRGCMVATSLAMALAVLVAQGARVVDLDGPLLLARDRPDGLVYEGSRVHPATPALWG